MNIYDMSDKELIALITPYFENKKRHKNYMRAMDVYWHLSFHADGYFKRPGQTQSQWNQSGFAPNPYFKRLIDDRRPNESDAILGYRRNVYRPFSQAPFNTVLTSLQKIFKSEDYFVNYSKSEIPAYFSKQEELENYCEKNYPQWDSISNWAENLALRWNLVDPNALCVVMPLNYEAEDNQLLNPFAHIIQTKDVLDYKEDQYAVFVSPYVHTYYDEQGNEKSGKIVCLITPRCIYEARQINDDNKFEFELKLEHNIGTLPAFLLKGEAVSPDPISPFYESFLKSMLPNLDELASVSSDASAELIQHMYSEKWYIQPQVCKDCNGLKTTLIAGKQVTCPTCDGRGTAPKTPYQDYIINPQNAIGEKFDIPTPPVGYVTKDTKIVELLMDIMDRHGYHALSAVHMQLLWNSPLSKMKESGIAKAYDQSETNNFVHKIAYNLINNIINQVYYYTNEIRYGIMVPDKLKREEMLPTILVPNTYDIITQQAVEANLAALNTAEVSPMIKAMAEMDYLHVKYPDSIMRDKLQISQDHDPFGGKTIEEKIALLNSDAVDKVDVVLSFYIDSFVGALLSESDEFANYDYAKQSEILYKMASDKMNKMDAIAAAKEVISEPSPIEDVPVKKENQEIDPSVRPRKKERNDLEFS